MHYNTIVLKLSGELLADKKHATITKDALIHYAQQIIEIHNQGIHIAVVLGGGNIYRGRKPSYNIAPPIEGDYMGMLATMINSIALYNTLKEKGVPTLLMTQVNMQNIYENYNRIKALHYLQKGYIIIIGGGLGKACFTTDSAASLYAIELAANLLVKGTQVDGVYSADPKKDPTAQLHKHITIQEVLDKKLKIMDTTALTLCNEATLPIIVYNATKTTTLLQILKNPTLGTLIAP